jgi:hypothetical protein
VDGSGKEAKVDEKGRWTRGVAPLVALVALRGVAGCDGGEPDWLDPSLGCANLPQLVGRWTGGFESEVFDDGGGNLLLVVTDTDEARCEAVGTVTVTLDLAPGQRRGRANGSPPGRPGWGGSPT